jgi:hypothetical protein
MSTILNTTQQYNAADVVTHTNLNQIVGGTTFVAGDDGATDNTSLEVDTTSGSLQIKDNGVTTAKLLDSTDKTDGVTLPKIQHVDTAKVLGRTSTGEGNVEEVTLNTDDAMANASATTLATDGSIKAYVDSRALDPSRGYNSFTHSTASNNVQKNETGRPLWVSFTLFSNGGGLNYLLGSISPNDDFSGSTRIGQGRVVSQYGYSSGAQVTMIVPAGYSWSFAFSPSSTTERVHSSFML